MQTRSDPKPVAAAGSNDLARADSERQPGAPRSIFTNFGATRTTVPCVDELAQSSSPAGAQAARPAIEPGRSTQLPSAFLLQTEIELAMARSFFHQFVAKLFEYPARNVEATGDKTSVGLSNASENSVDAWDWLTGEDTLEAVLSAATVSGLTTIAGRFVDQLRQTTFDRFLDTHLLAFGHAARGPVPMNEIEYGDFKADPLFQPHRLADLAAFYRAFGLELAPDASERQDHICLQLEFMSVLAAKEAYALEYQLEDDALEVCRSAQKEFLREHLGRWVPAFTRRLESSCDEPIAISMAEFTRAWISAECARFGVRPGSDQLVLRPVDDEAESLCASCGIRNLPPGALTTT